MAELKTQRNNGSVDAYLKKAAGSPEILADCRTLIEIMSKATGAPPQMWGTAIVGFGSFRYRYDNGREIDWMLCGFSPRKTALSLYLFGQFPGYDDLLAKLGKHSCGKSCLYLKRLSGVHLPTLRKLVTESVKYTKRRGSADREAAKAEGRAKRAAKKSVPAAKSAKSSKMTPVAARKTAAKKKKTSARKA